MALKATVFKANLQIADMDRNYYDPLSLTVARHPSETDERMMLRLLAFALHANDKLAFTKGLCVDDEPDLWQKSLADEIELWIEVGLPDENRIRKACRRARQVVLYAYGGRPAQIWWSQVADQLQRFDNLTVWRVPPRASTALAGLARRTMELHCTIQEGQVWFSDADTSVLIELERLFP